MAQRFKDEAGNIWEMGPNGQPSLVAASPSHSLANPKLPGELTGQSLGNQKTAFELAQARAQASADTRIKNAQAIQEEQKAADAKFAAGDALGDPKLTGVARFASIPLDKRPMVRLLLDNDLQQLGGFALGKPALQSLISTAKAVDPSFDPSVFGIRYGAMRDFSGGGKNSAAVAAADRLALNLKQLKSVSDQMGGPNIGWGPGNAAIASTQQSFEPTLRASYDALLPEIANQFDLIMKSNKGVPTVSGIGEVMHSLRRGQSQAERDAAMTQVVKAVRGAIEPIKAQWQSAYGGNSSPPMWISSEAAKFYGQIDPEHAGAYNPNDTHGIPGLHGLPGETPPPVAPSSPPDSGTGGGPPPIGAGGIPHADYSSMVGGPNQSLAQTDPNSKLGAFKQTYRNAYDPVAASVLSAFIRKGEPYATAAAYAQSHGFNPPNPDDYAAGVAFAKQHRGATNVTADKLVPTSFGERVASSPASAFVAGGLAGGTAGFTDTIGRTLAGPGWDANRRALTDTHPTADFLGNVAGGAAGMLGGEAVLGKLAPGLIDAARASRLAPFLPAASDAAYGGIYGANENPDNPFMGALEGTAAGLGGGMFARAVTRGVGRAIAPTGGDLAPIFAANPSFRPTIGQRLSASPSRLARAIGMGEQAAESIPGLGGIQTSARTAATDEMQRGAYNHALSDLAPFNPILGRDVSQLPNGVTKGVKANDFLHESMSDAQETARSGMQFAADPQYADEVGAWQRNPDAMSLTTDQINHVKGTIAQAMKGRMNADGTMQGQAYGAAASDLARVARNWSGNPATAPQASYLRDYLSIMDDAAKRNSPPQAGALLDAANRGYAKSVIIENAAKAAGGEPTEFTGKQLLRAVQNSDPSVRDRAFLSGQALMQPYAMAASKLSPSLADSGTAQRLAWMKAGGTAEATALGGAAALGHPMALAPLALDTIANLPGIRNVVGAAMAPRSATLSAPLADLLNGAGNGIYKRASKLGMFGAPAALAYLTGQ